MSIQLSPAYVGEIPRPFDVVVTDLNGNAADLTGATSVCKARVDDGAEFTLTSAVIDPANGVVRVTPVAGNFDQAGVMRGVVYTSGAGYREVATVFVVVVKSPPVPIT